MTRQSQSVGAKSRARDSGPDTPLNRDSIVDGAIALLNEAGFDGVSLRRLASRLGVKAPSLYWHFKDKAELLAAVSERIFLDCLDSVPAHREWPKWMRAFGKALWRAQRNTRDFSHVLNSAQFPEAHFTRMTQRLLQAMVHLDLPQAEAMRLQSSIQALVTGWAVFASAPYAAAMRKLVDFETELMIDMDLLIDGEQLRLEKAVSTRKRKASG